MGTASKLLFAYNGIPILNRTEIISEYVVRFVLNVETVVWEKLLGNIACSIVLPDPDYSIDTRFLNRIDINDELIGTGPFQLNDYVFDDRVEFSYNPDYHFSWGENHIEEMIYEILPDSTIRSLSVLNHMVHWGDVTSEYDDALANDLNLTKIPVKTANTNYVQMNLYTMKHDYRYASSFIWNHTYYLQEILEGKHFEIILKLF